MSYVLTRDFYDRPTLLVARDLIGCVLCSRVNGQAVSGRIVEVEAYIGENDSACHAAKGRTERTEIMYGKPGYAYIYFTYGMHWLFNAVTEKEESPCAVLVRAIEPVDGLDIMLNRRKGRGGRQLTSGPAKLCQALQLNKLQNAADLTIKGEVYIQSGSIEKGETIITSVRRGIDYALPEDKNAPWRFFIKGNQFVS